MPAGKKMIVALAQVRQTDDIGRNLRTIGRFIARAQHARADLVCFPETALTGYGPALHESSARWDCDAVEAAVAEIRELARDARVAVVLGTHLSLNGGWTNSTLLIRRDGRIVGRYDKAHLYKRDPEYYRAGRERARAFPLHGNRIGLQICFDIRFPQPFRALALAGAKLIVVPSYIHGAHGMWKNPVIAAHAASRAGENGRFVAFVNAAGRTQNVPSLVANPRGEIVAKCRRAAEQFLTVELDMTAPNDDVLMCRRSDLYPDGR